MDPKISPAAGLIRHRFVRCLLTALFIAAFTVACSTLLGLMSGRQQAYGFLLVLFTGFIGAQVHERMLALAKNT